MGKNNQEYSTVDLNQIFKALWRRAWVLVLCGLLAAALGFSASAFLIAPKYSSSIMLYVNNSALSIEGFSLSQLSAAQSLVKTYIVMLQNRTSLEGVIDKTDVDYTYEELEDMISASAVNETEVMRITVTTHDPYESAKIANGIAEVLPQRISEVIEGASMEVVDSAIPELEKVSPSIARYTAVGFLVGILLAAIVIAVSALLDDTIHDEEYIIQNYDLPILAKVPDLLNSGGRKYGYYYQKKQNKKDTGN